jgi:hypothetical protein
VVEGVKTMSSQLISFRYIVNGPRRPIYEDAEGQYVLNDDGERLYGLFFFSEECCDLPVIVDGPGDAER